MLDGGGGGVVMIRRRLVGDFLVEAIRISPVQATINDRAPHSLFHDGR